MFILRTPRLKNKFVQTFATVVSCLYIWTPIQDTMRIVHLTSANQIVQPKKSAKERLHERCVLMVANQTLKDRAEAEKFRYLLERGIS